MAGSPGPGQAVLAMGTGPARSAAPGLLLPPRRMEDLPKILGPPPPRRLAGPGWTPHRSAPRWPGPEPGGGGGTPGRRRAVGLPVGGGCRAGGGGGLLGFTAGAQAQRPAGGGAEPGLCLTPWSPAPRQRPRPLRYATPTVGGDALGEWVRASGSNTFRLELNNWRELRADCLYVQVRCLLLLEDSFLPSHFRSLSVGGRVWEAAGFLGSMDQQGKKLDPLWPMKI